MIGYGVIVRKTCPDRLLSVARTIGTPVPLGPSGIAEIDLSGLETGAYRIVVTGSDGRPIATRGIMVVR